MSSVECLREFVNERLTAAAEEIFGVFQKTIVEYEEEIYRQRKLLDIVWKPEIKLHRIDLQQQHVRKEEEEEVLTDQQLCNQERSSSLDQEDPEPVQIKEEQEELCTSQEGEEVVLKVDAATCMLTPTDEERDHDEPEPESDHQLPLNNFYAAESQDQKGYEHEDSTRDVESEQNSQQYENKSHSNIVCNPNLSEADSNIHIPAFKCNTCGKDCRHKSDLLRHMREHSVGKLYLCSICGKTFSRDDKLKQHERLHTDLQQQHVCKEEEEEVLTDQQLCNQERSSSLDQEDPEPLQIKEEQEELCTSQEGEEVVLKVEAVTCMVTPNDEEKDHVEPEPESDHQLLLNNFSAAESQDQKGYKHEDSKQKQSNQQYENRSNSNIVCNPDLSEIGGNALKIKYFFKCDNCGKDFKNKSLLRRHTRIHTGEKPYICTTCGKSFGDSSTLKGHIGQVHADERPFLCNTCGKAFGKMQTLRRHQIIHTGEKPYTCTTCGKSFAHSSNLKEHIRQVHADERPHLCNTCGKTFGKMQTLRRHQRIHTGEKPYICTTCGKAFTFHAALNKHTRIHTGERPHLCKICGKGFHVPSQLKAHAETHAAEKTYACNMCEKRYCYRRNLKIHMKIHAGE